jgi:Uncharacterized conserved protein
VISRLFQMELQDLLALVALLVVFIYLLLRSIPDQSRKPRLRLLKIAMWAALAVAVGFGLWMVVQRWAKVQMLFEQIRFMGLSDVVIAVVDITVMSYFLYRIIILVRGTRAVQLFKGILALVIATSVSRWLGLVTINWS